MCMTLHRWGVSTKQGRLSTPNCGQLARIDQIEEEHSHSPFLKSDTDADARDGIDAIAAECQDCTAGAAGIFSMNILRSCSSKWSCHCARFRGHRMNNLTSGRLDS